MPAEATRIHVTLLAFALILPLPAQADEWSHQITWRTQSGWYAAPVHVSLLPDGRLLLFGQARPTEDPHASTERQDVVFAMAPTPLGQANLPAEITVENMASDVPLDASATFVPPSWRVSDSLFCSGHTLMDDGTLFVAGGSRVVAGYEGAFHLIGLSYSTTFDGTSWARVPDDMVGAGNIGEPWRWYSTATRLADSRILITGGHDYVLGDYSEFFAPLYTSPNYSVEVYDPDAGVFELVSPHADSPYLVYNADYSHVFQLPSRVGGLHDILIFGEYGMPVLMSPTESPRWKLSTKSRPGSLAFQESPNHGTSTVLLPLRVNDGEWGYSNGAVLMAGGRHDSVHEHSIDVYDPFEDIWLEPSIDMQVGRHHPSTLLLPDGRILVIEGHNEEGNVGTSRAQYVDPTRGFELTSGESTHQEVRGYHTVSVLLPDGRVLIGGGNDDGRAGNEKSNFRYYSPSYLERPRPAVLQLSSTELQVGGYYYLIWESANSIEEIVLMGLGSMTHSIDMNQRYVQLPVVDGARFGTTSYGYTVFQAPPHTMVAPPGDYMLFALDGERAPSEAAFVQLRP